MTCDFFLPSHNFWLEYFGLAGEHSNYDKTIERKKQVATNLGLRFGFLVPLNLYPENKIREVLAGFGLIV